MRYFRCRASAMPNLVAVAPINAMWDGDVIYDLLSAKERNAPQERNLVWVAATCVAILRRSRKASHVSVHTANASRARAASATSGILQFIDRAD
jgi:hypothetical protein